MFSCLQILEAFFWFVFITLLNVSRSLLSLSVFFFQAEDGIRDLTVTGVQTCALPISGWTVAPSVAIRGHHGRACGTAVRHARGYGPSRILPRGHFHRARRVDPLPHRTHRPEIGDPGRTPRHPARGRGGPLHPGRPPPSIVAPSPDRRRGSLRSPP